MNADQVLEWVVARTSHINKYKTFVKEVRLYNQVENHYGKTYYRIYLEIIHKGLVVVMKPNDQLNEAEKMHNEMFVFDRNVPNYISFYDRNYNEENVQIHHDWVLAMFSVLARDRPFICTLSTFKRESIKSS
jgi:hypothetical protein